jgi:hypothetical protein
MQGMGGKAHPLKTRRARRMEDPGRQVRRQDVHLYFQGLQQGLLLVRSAYTF